jgi:hypothetical protein
MGVVSQAVVVEVRMRQDDGRDARSAPIMCVESGDVPQDPLVDEVAGRTLWRVSRVIATVQYGGYALFADNMIPLDEFIENLG